MLRIAKVTLAGLAVLALQPAAASADAPRPKLTSIVASYKYLVGFNKDMARFPAVSPEGRYFAFASQSKADDGSIDTKVYGGDLWSGQTAHLSQDQLGNRKLVESGPEAVRFTPRLPAVLFPTTLDGRSVVVAKNFVTNELTILSTDAQGAPVASDRSIRHLNLSADGNRMVFDAGGAIWVKTVSTGKLTHASLTGDGKPVPQADFPVISLDGRYVAFTATTSFILPDAPADRVLTNIFVKDLLTGRLTQVATNLDPAKEGIRIIDACHLVLSPDGFHIAFMGVTWQKTAQEGMDYFVIDPVAGDLVLASSPDGRQQSGGFKGYGYAAFSPDGRLLAFSSFANKVLGPSVTAGDAQIYVKNLQTGRLSLASTLPNGEVLRGLFGHPAFTPDGQGLIVSGWADKELVKGVPFDTNGAYLARLAPGWKAAAQTDTQRAAAVRKAKARLSKLFPAP